MEWMLSGVEKANKWGKKQEKRERENKESEVPVCVP